MLLLAPALAFLAIVYVGPVLYTLSLSVTEPGWGLANFARALGNPIYLATFRTTFEIAISVALLCLSVAYPTALFIVTRSPRMQGILLAVVLVPFFTSLLVRNYAWIFLLGSRGVINTALIGLGLIEHPVPLLFNRTGVLIGMTHILSPYLILVLVTALRAIDPHLARAGASLGAGPFSTFRQIVLPLSRAGAGAGFILVFVIALAFFVTPAMLGSPRDAMIANVIASEIGFLHWGFAASLGVVLLVATLVAVVLMQRAFGGLALIAPGLDPRARAPRLRRAFRLGDGLWRRLDDVMDPIWPGFVAVLATAILILLVLPIVVVVPLSLSSAEYFVFPPPGWSTRWYEAFFSNWRWTEAAWNSVLIGLMTVVLTMALAVPAALGIARSRSNAVIGAYLLIVSPLVIPAIITAISVFIAFTTIGLPRSAVTIALGHTVGALPLAVVVLVAALAQFDWTLERAAQSLGASNLGFLLRIVLPIVSGAVATAAFLAFLHSFDDLLIALFLGGLRLETLPRRMWESLQEINPTIAAVSTLMIAVMIALLVALQVFRDVQARRLRPGSAP